MFRGLLSWLGLDAPRPIVGLRPHRTVDVPNPYDVAYDRALAAMDAVLGANVRDADRATGVIDGDFGTIGGERLRVTLARTGAATTRADIEARFQADAQPRARSAAVDALAEYLSQPL